MFPATQQLFQRLAARFPHAREWFDALRQWYKDAKLSAAVIQQLLRGENVELVSVRLNGEDAPTDVTRELDGQRVLVLIPAARLRVGENALTLGLSDDAEQPLEIEAVELDQPRSHLRQSIALDTVRPAPAPAFQLTGSERAEPRAGCWEVRASGRLDFRFYLHTEGEAVVALDLPAGARFPQSRARLAKQKKLLKDVGKRVEGLLKKWIDEAAKRNDPQSHDLLHDLRAYAELYAKQIRPTIESEGTLKTAIDRTGNPDGIVSANARPVPLQQAVVPLVAAPAAAFKATRVENLVPLYRAVRPPRAKLVKAPSPPAPRQPAPRRSVPARSAAKSSGFAGKLLMTLVFAGLSAAAYAAWKNDGMGWVQRQFAGTSGQSKSRGDVLAALREASVDVGWQPAVCQDLSADESSIFVANSGSQVVGWGSKSDASYVYLAGDRKIAGVKDGDGLPLCDSMLVVIEFDTADAAKRHFDGLPQQFKDSLRVLGQNGTSETVTVPNCDGAFCQTSPSKDGGTKQEVIARTGRFIVQMASCKDYLKPDDQEKKLGTLAKRLNEHFPR